MSDYVLQPVGYVRNAIPTPEDIPYNGAPSTLELLEEYAEATVGLEPGYVWVLTWLHQSERRPARKSPDGTRGSFASRTPYRVNPVAVTAARLLSIDGPRLYVDALDVCDGTPLLDVKPYVRDFDCIFGPAEPAWRRAALPEQRLARIVRTIERFCGPLTAELALAARVALAADRDLDVAANSQDLRWGCFCSLGITAGIQAVSGAPLNSLRLLLGADESRVGAGVHKEWEVVYHLRTPALSAAEILTAPEADLLERLTQ